MVCELHRSFKCMDQWSTRLQYDEFSNFSLSMSSQCMLEVWSMQLLNTGWLMFLASSLWKEIIAMPTTSASLLEEGKNLYILICSLWDTPSDSGMSRPFPTEIGTSILSGTTFLAAWKSWDERARKHFIISYLREGEGQIPRIGRESKKWEVECLI